MTRQRHLEVRNQQMAKKAKDDNTATLGFEAKLWLKQKNGEVLEIDVVKVEVV